VLCTYFALLFISANPEIISQKITSSCDSCIIRKMRVFTLPNAHLFRHFFESCRSAVQLCTAGGARRGTAVHGGAGAPPAGGAWRCTAVHGGAVAKKKRFGGLKKGARPLSRIFQSHLSSYLIHIL
jgi:hypothetical protein